MDVLAREEERRDGELLDESGRACRAGELIQTKAGARRRPLVFRTTCGSGDSALPAAAVASPPVVMPPHAVLVVSARNPRARHPAIPHVIPRLPDVARVRSGRGVAVAVRPRGDHYRRRHWRADADVN